MKRFILIALMCLAGCGTTSYFTPATPESAQAYFNNYPSDQDAKIEVGLNEPICGNSLQIDADSLRYVECEIKLQQVIALSRVTQISYRTGGSFWKGALIGGTMGLGVGVVAGLNREESGDVIGLRDLNTIMLGSTGLFCGGLIGGGISAAVGGDRNEVRLEQLQLPKK